MGARSLLPGIHGLRALAAIGIILFHLGPLTGIPVPPSLWFVTNYFGQGVPLFFVIRGFSLASSASSRTGSYDWIRTYLMRRLFRIAPLFYAVMAVTLAFVYKQLPTDPAVYVLNLTFA